MQNSQNILELEHSIGYNGKFPRSVLLHPNHQDYVYISGACIVITNLNDPHKQDFLRGHDNQVTCLAVSNKGGLIASGQTGDNSDVIIWDFEFKKLKFKLSEHDYEVAVV
jgi:WD40 repeat protein